MTPALLALENGTVFQGFAFGDTEAEAQGEVVFNTAMTGYAEALTDPSYTGQILTFTYPHIGNYGVSTYDVESDKIQAAGLIVREYCAAPSNWRADWTLAEFMQQHKILGIEGIDTRALVRILRSEGAMRGIISAKEHNPDILVDRARALPSMNGLDLTGLVTTEKTYLWKPNPNEPFIAKPLLSTSSLTTSLFNRDKTEEREIEPFRVAAIDFGIKRNILRRLSQYGCEVTVFPATTSAEEIREHNPDGIFLSNGPGDPAAVDIRAIRELLTEKPIFGICLGHQLLGLAFGATTYKLKFGHRGANHPVKNLLTGHIEITSQNHGFAVDEASMSSELELTHVNLNDNTVSGFRHRSLPVFCVQYHPEASPGTHDSDYLFGQFVEYMKQHQRSSVHV